MLMRILAMAAVSCAAQWVQAEDWPQWRGPHGDGVSTEKSVATKWSKTEHIAWRSPLPGQGGATPVAWGDKLFVTSADDDALYCFASLPTTGNNFGKNKLLAAIKTHAPAKATRRLPLQQPMASMSGSFSRRESWLALISMAMKFGSSMSASVLENWISNSA